MKVLITDLTRMHGGRICIAGVDVDSGRRVRPVCNATMTTRLLATRGGPADLRRVIDIGRTAAHAIAPEVEDTRFALGNMRHHSTLDGATFLERLRKLAVEDFSPIGPLLVRQGHNLVVPQGKGRCSLLVIRTTEPVRVRINSEGRLRLRWQDDLDLAITDVRLFTDDMRFPVAERVRSAQRELAAGGEVFLCFGLGRPYLDVHWLQLNNFHMAANPEWQLQ